MTFIYGNEWEFTDKNAEILVGITLQCSPMIIYRWSYTDFWKIHIGLSWYVRPVLGISGVPTIIHANSFGVATIIPSIQEFLKGP